jgi:hypothetical protein
VSGNLPLMKPGVVALAFLLAVPAVAQAPRPENAPACRADGFARETVDKMTGTLLDMGFVGFERMEIVEGCYRVVARNGRGEVVTLTFDEGGALIGLGVGSTPPRFAPPRDGIRPAD